MRARLFCGYASHWGHRIQLNEGGTRNRQVTLLSLRVDISHTRALSNSLRTASQPLLHTVCVNPSRSSEDGKLSAALRILGEPNKFFVVAELA
jgi:hypothetical protein